MTKRKKTLPARKPRDRFRDDDSLLLRSAESLGRVIGALQRQLDGATKRLSETAGEAFDQLPSMREITDTVTVPIKGTLRRAARKTPKRTSATEATKGSRKKAPSRKRGSSKTIRKPARR